jgi:hypothetical protein
MIIDIALILAALALICAGAWLFSPKDYSLCKP